MRNNHFWHQVTGHLILARRPYRIIKILVNLPLWHLILVIASQIFNNIQQGSVQYSVLHLENIGHWLLTKIMIGLTVWYPVYMDLFRFRCTLSTLLHLIIVCGKEGKRIKIRFNSKGNALVSIADLYLFSNTCVLVFLFSLLLVFLPHHCHC